MSVYIYTYIYMYIYKSHKSYFRMAPKPTLVKGFRVEQAGNYIGPYKVYIGGYLLWKALRGATLGVFRVKVSNPKP